MNMPRDGHDARVLKDRQRAGASGADIDPMQIDKTVNFSSVGGLNHHIRSLKEMIVFPLMYPEVFYMLLQKKKRRRRRRRRRRKRGGGGRGRRGETEGADEEAAAEEGDEEEVCIVHSNTLPRPFFDPFYFLSSLTKKKKNCKFFERFKMDPPRGVLFYGPPGTGKTLCARALANECSKAGRHVSFFMRKGADCLSKWVGESERMLRLLFDQAYKVLRRRRRRRRRRERRRER